MCQFLGYRLQVTGCSVSRGSFASLKGSHALHEGSLALRARGEFKFPFFKKGWPKAGVVKLSTFNFQFSTLFSLVAGPAY